MAAKVLHLIASNFISGPEKQILHHARSMPTGPFAISIASFRDLGGEPEIVTVAKSYGIEAYSVRGGFNPLQITELAGVMRRNHIAALCTHGYKANIMGRLAAKLARVPHAAFVRGWTAETWRVRLYERLERRVLAHTPWVVCVSTRQMQQLQPARRRAGGLVVVPNAVLPEVTGDAAPFTRADAGIPQDAFVFAAAGRLSIEKGHVHLLHAFAELVRRQPAMACYLVILGEGREQSSLERLAVDLGISSKVMFAGFRRNIRQWMHLADCLAQPSLTEGTPNSVLEALQANLPVIATAVGGVPDLLSGGAGLLVPAADANALADAMESVLTSPELRAGLARGMAALDAKYRPESQRAALLHLYEQMLAGRRPQP